MHNAQLMNQWSLTPLILLDGVYYMVAQEEAAIRKDPLGQASSLLKKVFGVLK
jgi:Protein of unknown function (DUF4197)